MEKNSAMPTLLSVILSNQVAMAKAIEDVAAWIQSNGDVTVANAVKEKLRKVEESQQLVGGCIGSLMK